MNRTNNYKLCLMDTTKVGKPRVVDRCLKASIPSSWEYMPPLGVEVHPYVFRRNGRTICVNIWDTAGDPRLIGSGDAYLSNAHLCVIY